jgi:hypothetical protein
MSADAVPQIWMATAEPAAAVGGYRSADPTAASRRREASWYSPTVLIALPVVALLLALAYDQGGYATTAWYPAALITVGVALVAWMAAARPWGSCSAAEKLALLALFGYLALSYASIAWASSRGVAFEGSNRTLLYVALFALCIALPWSSAAARAALIVFALGIGVIALVTLASVLHGHVAATYIRGQLASPIGYANATAALGTMGFFVALSLACRREVHWLIRGLLAGSAVASIELALLAQSRGWLYTLPFVAAAVFVCAPARGRLALWTALASAAAVATLPTVTRTWIYAAPGHATVSASGLERTSVAAAGAALTAAAVCACVGWLLARFDDYFGVAPSITRGLRRTWKVLGIALLVAALAGAAVTVSNGSAERVATSGWRSFSSDGPPGTPQGSRLTVLGSGRADMWRVGADDVAAHPLLGLGQDNFAESYVQLRKTTEQPSWVHSLELRLLVHTGIVGFVLFAVFMVAALVAAKRGWRRADPTRRALIGAALVPLIDWTIHGSIDWFWEIPALSCAAFGFLAVAVVVARGPRHRRPAMPERGAAAWVARFACLVAVGAAAGFALVPASLAERDLAQAHVVAATQPGKALALLNQAGHLEPLDADPAALAASIDLAGGDAGAATAELHTALARDPGDWLSWLELGIADGATGARAQGFTALERAKAENPSEPLVQQAISSWNTKHPMTAPELFNALTGRINALAQAV